MSLATGDVLAERYRVDAPLGQGGMGVTYRATRLEDGLEVALKTLDLRRAEDWKSVELFEREADVLRAIDLPGVPEYLDSFSLDDGAGFALVQELAPGEPLDRVLARGSLPLAEVVDLAEQVLATLCGLQAMQPPIVHRDIKPANLVRADDGTVRLVDFGAVKAVWEEAVGGGSTVVGTFGYMAPEQFRGAASRATDVYGLGATLLHAVSGREPSSFEQDRLAIRFRDSVDVPEAFATWLERMLAPHEEDRFPDAASALEALRAPSEPATRLEPLPASSRVRVSERNGVHRLDIKAPWLRATSSRALFTMSFFWNTVVGIMTIAFASGFFRNGGGFDDWFPLVFLIPFMVIGAGMFFGGLHGITSRYGVEFSRDGWALELKSWLRRRHYEGPAHDLVHASEGPTGVTINGRPQEAVFLETRTDQLRIGADLTEYERRWIVAWFEEQRARFALPARAGGLSFASTAREERAANAEAEAPAVAEARR